MNASQAIKRLVDVTIATLVLIVTMPVLALVAMLIWVLEGRPVVYVSRRQVSVGRTIPVYKFRTMVRDATSGKYRLEERFMRGGYLDIPRTCEVYTPIGRILERLQIVELPQMVNVLFHGMSLIGNRPLPSENVRLLRKREGWRKRFDSPAGITGIAQVVGRRKLAPGQRLELEAAYSKMYQEGNIAWCDLKIFYYTLLVIVFSKGIPLERAYQLVGAEEKVSALQSIVQTSTQP
jgi:lipopolysaccharide/colanic/teichoic acid biosynthesis glycosyltransferase